MVLEAVQARPGIAASNGKGSPGGISVVRTGFGTGLSDLPVAARFSEHTATNASITHDKARSPPPISLRSPRSLDSSGLR